MKNKPLLIIILFIISLICIAVSLRMGSVAIAWRPFWATLFGHGSQLDHAIIWQLRFPRTLSAFVCGGLLAFAGAVLQVLLRNPLADPYILGVSGGASVASLLAMLLGITSAWLNAWAFIGALISILLVFQLARVKGVWSPTRLLLTGVIIAAGWAALISFILTLSPNRDLHSMLFWLMGDLAYARFSYIGLIILVLAYLINLCWSRDLNLLSHGEKQAQGLGVNTKQLNIKLYFLSAVLTASAVSIAGSIGFVGLIVPHMIRLLKVTDHRILIPAVILLGGSLLTLADMLARIILAPLELPVGIITALIGVPIFLYLLIRGYQQWH